MRLPCPSRVLGLFWVIGACAGSEPVDGEANGPDTGEADSGDTDSGDTDSGDTDSGGLDTGADSGDSGDSGDTGDSGSEDACPVGMAPVRDEYDAISFCVDIFEASLGEGALGNEHQGTAWPDGSTTATVDSVEGVLPATVVTWYQAVALCLNSDKHLCSVSEWQDACDGTVGDGGQIYPYGDVWDDDACVTTAADGTEQWAELQPTGSLETCVSPVGAYDLAGNAWEWADGGGIDEQGLPITDKLGGAYYVGVGNAACGAPSFQEHAPDFNGTIGLRCCASPLR